MTSAYIRCNFDYERQIDKLLYPISKINYDGTFKNKSKDVSEQLINYWCIFFIQEENHRIKSKYFFDSKYERLQGTFAAALCVKLQKSPKDINMKMLQDQLIKQRAEIGQNKKR